MPLLSLLRLTQPISTAYKLTITWGGLRGALTLVLALAVTENPVLTPEVQRFVAVLATGLVLFTLLVNGTTLRAVIRLFGLDRLSPVAQALRDRILALSYSDIADAIRASAREHEISPAAVTKANLFMIFAPLEGWRRVEVTDHHTAVDYAKVLKELSDLHFPAAEKIVLVQDNLSTHPDVILSHHPAPIVRPLASLYTAFPAPEARRLANRFEWHYTPKHGSWLDMAESELAVLTTQCLSRRIPDNAYGDPAARSFTPRSFIYLASRRREIGQPFADEA